MIIGNSLSPSKLVDNPQNPNNPSSPPRLCPAPHPGEGVTDLNACLATAIPLSHPYNCLREKTYDSDTTTFHSCSAAAQYLAAGETLMARWR
jgi:hypothetical protein